MKPDLAWMLIVLIFGALGFLIGLDQGTPIYEITETVWVERPEEPYDLLLLDMACRLVPNGTQGMEMTR